MPEEDALVCLQETTDRVHIGLKHFRNESLDWISFWPSHDRADYVIPIGNERWKELSALAQSLKKARRESLGSIEKSRKELLSFLPLLDSLDRLAPDLPPPLPRIAGWKEQKQKLIAAMRKIRMPEDKIEAILKAEEKRDFRKSPQQLRTILDHAIERLETARHRHIASLIGAIHANAVARFNASYKRAKPYDAEGTRTWCRTNRGMLLDGEKVIWQLLRDGKPKKASAEAAKLRKKAEASLKSGAELAASVAVRRRQTGSGAPENIAALWVAEVVRGLLRAIALGYVAESALAWGEKMEATQEWMKAAQKLPFDGLDSPPAIPVSKFKKRKTGQDYTIAGVVTGVSITHRAGKAVSAVKIATDKDNQITAALSHIKLDSGGMVPGAVVRLTGTWTDPIKWHPGGPALVVKRLNYSELSQKGWRDWVTGAIRNTYAPIAHGLAAIWSWEPGTNGAGNPLYYGVWYEE
jgi:hypothetical protein